MLSVLYFLSWNKSLVGVTIALLFTGNPCTAPSLTLRPSLAYASDVERVEVEVILSFKKKPEEMVAR